MHITIDTVSVPVVDVTLAAVETVRGLPGSSSISNAVSRSCSGSVSATGVLKKTFEYTPLLGLRIFFGGMTMIRKPTVNVMHEQSPCHMSAPVHPATIPEMPSF